AAVAVLFLRHLVAMPRGGRHGRPTAELALGAAPAAPAAKTATFCIGICAPKPAATLPPSKPPRAGEVQWVSVQSDTPRPSGLINAGVEPQQSFVCRAAHRGAMYPGQ